MARPNDDMKQHLMRKISINRQASRSPITNWVIGNTTQERVLQRLPSQLNMPMQDDYMQVSRDGQDVAEGPTGIYRL